MTKIYKNLTIDAVPSWVQLISKEFLMILIMMLDKITRSSRNPLQIITMDVLNDKYYIDNPVLMFKP